jgi:hypothetical protein
MINALKFIDHFKAKCAEIRQPFDHSLVDEAIKL